MYDCRGGWQPSFCVWRSSNCIWLTYNCISTWSGSPWVSCTPRRKICALRGDHFLTGSRRQVCAELGTQLDKYSAALPEKQMELPFINDHEVGGPNQEASDHSRWSTSKMTEPSVSLPSSEKTHLHPMAPRSTVTRVCIMLMLTRCTW